MKRFRLLTTKKISPALVMNAGLKGVEILEKEFIIIRPTVDHQNNSITNLFDQEIYTVFTSKNAIISIAGKKASINTKWKIFCIDGATALHAEKVFGKEKIVDKATTAFELAQSILQHDEIKKVYFFCGDIRMNALPDTLKSKGVEVVEIEVYKTQLAPQKIIDDYDAVAFFSPSAVKSFFSNNTLHEGALCFSIGRTTSEMIRRYTANKIYTMEKSSEEHMIETAINISNKNY